MWIFVIAVAVLVQVGYWAAFRRGFRRACEREPGAVRDAVEAAEPITVVVAVRNEEAVVGRLLQSLERQTHPDFEVIVVDDGSTDGTRDAVRNWTLRLAHFRLLAQEAANKKEALTAGIRAASHPLLAFTDADCGPPPTWLATLAGEHERRGAGVLIGYSPMRAGESGLAQRFARYETFVTGFFMLSAAGLNRPYMAVGRNLSYARRVFADIGGFAHSARSLSGDDDLFVQEVARRRAAPVHAVLDARSFVPTDAPPSWSAWIRAKRRHTSAGRFYRLPVKAHLVAFHASNALVWLAPFVVGWWGAAALAARFAWQFYVLRRPARMLGESDLMAALPAYEALYVLYNVIVAPLGVLRMPRTW